MSSPLDDWFGLVFQLLSCRGAQIGSEVRVLRLDDRFYRAQLSTLQSTDVADIDPTTLQVPSIQARVDSSDLLGVEELRSLVTLMGEAALPSFHSLAEPKPWP